MGKYDDAMYHYLSDNDRFADLFNAVFFDGEQVLNAGLLEPAPERHVTVLAQEDIPTSLGEDNSEPPVGGGLGLPVTESRFRDIRKRARTGESFVVTAIENQEVIDYAMPWRIMQYDQMEYGEQIRDIRRRKAAVLQAQGRKPSAWLTRLEAKDRLRPVYTICFYHGTEPWNGPRSLKDMMEFEGTNRTNLWKNCFHDYGMTLFCAGEADNLTRFGTDLRQLLEVLSMRKDKEGLAGLWSREDFSSLDRETAEIMAIMTDSIEILETLDNYENEKGECNMCLAMDELRRDWKAEGRAEGEAKGEANIIINMFKKGFTMEQIADAADKDIDEIRSLLRAHSLS